MKRMIQLAVCLVLLLATTFPVVASPMSGSIPCNPQFVQQNGLKITVLPTGNTNTGDTVNLQCAFDAATRRGSEVHLISGSYRTAQIVVNKFDGRFTGEGKDKTHIYNLPDLIVTPLNFYVNPPSAANPWPSLFSFVNGNIHVANLGFHIIGATPTTAWKIRDYPYFREFAIAIAFLGTKTNAYVDRILLEGEPVAESMFGYNLNNGIYFEGFIGEPSPPISGSFQVYNSVFRNVPFATPIYNISRATVVSSHNTYQNVIFGMDSNNMVNSSFMFTHNDVKNADMGVYLYSDIVEDGSSYLIGNNTFSGNNGITFENIFGKGTHCLVLGNSLKDITGTGIYLGPGTKGCLVAGSNIVEDVVDEGTGNIIIGTHHIGKGMGPAIQSFRKMFK